MIKKAVIIKPHTLPDCYVFVVRYVPLDINQDTARQQTLKTIPAVVGFSSIHYHHRQRPSYNILFTVRSLEQYQTALELGRLSIRQHYLPLTTFLIGYRLTYGTACWKIGYIRDKCQSPVSCPVDKDLTTGSIKRSAPGEISRPFQQYANDFPLLNRDKVNSHSAWTTSGNESLHSHLKKEMSDLVVTIKALSETMIRTEKSFNDLNNRIEVQHKSTILHCNSIERSKLKKNINKSIENLQKWKKQLDSNKSNQSTASISSPHLITTNNIIDNNNNGEVEMNDDFSMNSLDQDV
ncbi:unnamed protein product [Rotaria magnacalcarata]|uniref:Uncharacterized protein n=1 Tax=Rotaria magnacalcarata TaxID=392030 RepID=A0A817A4K5_9BILA|nr:unnamed protein product [Rotaria magnacalcarata]